MTPDDAPPVTIRGQRPRTDRTDDCMVDSAHIEGAELRLHVRYVGGTAEHLFGVTAAPAGAGDELALRVNHDARGDAGKAIVRTVLRFSLAAVAAEYRESRVVVLHLPGIDPLRYTPPAAGDSQEPLPAPE